MINIIKWRDNLFTVIRTRPPSKTFANDIRYTRHDVTVKLRSCSEYGVTGDPRNELDQKMKIN